MRKRTRSWHSNRPLPRTTTTTICTKRWKREAHHRSPRSPVPFAVGGRPPFLGATAAATTATAPPPDNASPPLVQAELVPQDSSSIGSSNDDKPPNNDDNLVVQAEKLPVVEENRVPPRLKTVGTAAFLLIPALIATVVLLAAAKEGEEASADPLLPSHNNTVPGGNGNGTETSHQTTRRCVQTHDELYDAIHGYFPGSDSTYGWPMVRLPRHGIFRFLFKRYHYKSIGETELCPLHFHE